MLETLNPRKRVRVWNPATQQYEENVSPERGGLMADTAAYMDQTKATEGRIADIWAGDRQREQLHQDTLRGRNLLVNAPTAGEIDRAGTVLAEGEAATQRGINAANPTAAGRRAKDRELAAARNLNPWRADAPYQPPPVPTGGLLHEAASLIPQTAPAAAQTPLMTDKERDFNTERADLNNLRSNSKKRGQEMLTEADRLETAGQTDHAAFIRSVARLLIAGVTDPTTIPSLAVRQALAHELSSIPRGVITAEGGYHGGLMRTSEQAAGRGQWVDPRILQRNAGEKATRETGLAKTEAEGAIAKGQAGLVGSAAAVAAQDAALGPEGRAKLAGAGSGEAIGPLELFDMAEKMYQDDVTAKRKPSKWAEYYEKARRMVTSSRPAPVPAAPGTAPVLGGTPGPTAPPATAPSVPATAGRPGLQAALPGMLNTGAKMPGYGGPNKGRMGVPDWSQPKAATAPAPAPQVAAPTGALPTPPAGAIPATMPEIMALRKANPGATPAQIEAMLNAMGKTAQVQAGTR